VKAHFYSYLLNISILKGGGDSPKTYITQGKLSF